MDVRVARQAASLGMGGGNFPDRHCKTYEGKSTCTLFPVKGRAGGDSAGGGCNEAGATISTPNQARAIPLSYDNRPE